MKTNHECIQISGYQSQQQFSNGLPQFMRHGTGHTNAPGLLSALQGRGYPATLHWPSSLHPAGTSGQCGGARTSIHIWDELLQSTPETFRNQEKDTLRHRELELLWPQRRRPRPKGEQKKRELPRRTGLAADRKKSLVPRGKGPTSETECKGPT